MRQELIEAFDELRADEEIRAVIMTGAGRGFCAGADLSGGGGASTDGDAGPSREQLLQEYEGTAAPALALYRRLDKPIIAAVNGPAAGAGMSLSLGCDMRVGCETLLRTVFLERNNTGDSV
jgi:2-(1,2-epoxy-1,2-dihydrophenyl)acetyl-CoA isomerase